MSDLIKVKSSSYSRYEELLIKRDQYEREVESILISYTKEFGELTALIFEKKIECIRLKKTIAYCQAAINRGELVDIGAVNDRLEIEMTVYRAQLDDMLKQNQKARDSKSVSIIDIEHAKRIYRRLARKLHPDINPQTATTPELSDIWNRVVIAYKMLDPKEMTELEVLANKIIEQFGLETIEVEIPDIEERIVLLEEEIHNLITTEPYTYTDILEDPEKTGAHREKLQNDLNETEQYCSSLEKTLHELLGKGDVTNRWRMN
ncbi:MAG: hypothetical protein HUJ78_06195 [Mogibacterium sp.]|nr:hypothetical protein [Mogibacterium sp.]